MKQDENQDLINTIIELSKDSDPKLQKNLLHLTDIYHSCQKENKRAKKQNDFFIKQWDKRNIIANERNAKKDKMLEQQSKMAAMGEMMDAVAHQWKQPLNSISMMSDLLKIDFENGEVDDAYVKDLTFTLDTQIEHMLTTLNEFRTFFRPSDEYSKNFHLMDCLKSVQVLMKDELLSHTVNVHIDVEENLIIRGLKNEFKHLFLNLINNSIYALEENRSQKRNIFIRAYHENSNIYIEVEDTAGGIQENVLHEVFKPNITTKKEGKGTGIGLYMVSQIVQKHHGKINVHNSELGAFFTITLH